MTEPVWSAAIRPDEVPEAGRHVELEANEAIRAVLAKPLGVDTVERAIASFDLKRRGRDGLHVEGRVKATVRQTCVVSLEALTNKIDEAVDVDFVPRRDSEPENPAGLDLVPAAADGPEPLIGNTVDLGQLAIEYLILGVDPYPRKPDARLEVPATGDPAGHPFAALAGWNKKGTVKE